MRDWSRTTKGTSDSFKEYIISIYIRATLPSLGDMQKLRAYIMILMYARIIVPRKTGGSQNEMVKEPPRMKELRRFLTFCVSTVTSASSAMPSMPSAASRKPPGL